MSNVVGVTREWVGVQCCKCYEGVGACPISKKKRYITLEWPHSTALAKLLKCIQRYL